MFFHVLVDNQSKSVIVELINNLWEGNITIHKCPADKENESFYIYHLVHAPADQTAYCAGEDVPCPKGYMYNGFECVGKCQSFYNDKVVNLEGFRNT